MESRTLLHEEDSKPASFTFGKVVIPFKFGLLLICAGVTLGGVGQQISLPIYLSTFGSFIEKGAYFVLWFCSLSFTIFFGMVAMFLSWKNVVTSEMKALKWVPYMVLVGLFDSINGIFAVYSAFLGRVPGALYAVLLQAYIPVTLIFSKPILSKKYEIRQQIGAGIVFCGVIISLVPLFEDLRKGVKLAAWWWPLITILSTVPGALMNIVQEKLQDDFRKEANLRHYRDANFSVFYLQAVESFFQWVFMTLWFWTDMIPGFGTSGTLSEFWSSFSFDFSCFFGEDAAIMQEGRCNYTGVLGLLFIATYIVSYIFGTYMTLYASANLVAIVQAVAPILVVIFWFSFPAVNIWAGGEPYKTTDIIFNSAALVCILPGIYLYQRFDQQAKEKIANLANKEMHIQI